MRSARVHLPIPGMWPLSRFLFLVREKNDSSPRIGVKYKALCENNEPSNEITCIFTASCLWRSPWKSQVCGTQRMSLLLTNTVQTAERLLKHGLTWARLSETTRHEALWCLCLLVCSCRVTEAVFVQDECKCGAGHLCSPTIK